MLQNKMKFLLIGFFMGFLMLIQTFSSILAGNQKDYFIDTMLKDPFFSDRMMFSSSLEVPINVDQNEVSPNTSLSLDHMLLVSIDQSQKNLGFKNFDLENTNDSLEKFDLVSQISNGEQITYLFQANTTEHFADFFARIKETFPNAKIQPNYRYDLFDYQPNDSDFDKLRAFSNTQWPKAIAALLEREYQTPPLVAVVDIGVDYNHLDLSYQMWSGDQCKKSDGTNWGNCEHGGASFFYSGVYLSGSRLFYHSAIIDKDPIPSSLLINPSNPEEIVNEWQTNDHGTHIAGTIGAEMNNGTGVVGVNPYVKIMAIKAGYVVGNDTYIFTENLVQAINFARHNGAKIINASRGLIGHDESIATAIENFTNAGGIFVTSAGNRANDASSTFPCNLSAQNPRVVCVGAINSGNTLAYFSNHSTELVGIAAPGVNIYSTTNGGNYKNKDGTSMATPMVAGGLSLLASYRPDLDADALISALYAGAEQITGLSAKIQSGRKLDLYESFKILDHFGPTFTGWVESSNWCLSGDFIYYFSGYDDLLDSDLPYSRDGGATWTSATSYLTGATGLSLQMRDGVGNLSYLLLDVSLPRCQPELKLTKSFSNTLAYTLDLETDFELSYQITGDVESGLFTGISDQSTEINIQLLSGDGEKNLYRTLSWAENMISGSGGLVLDTLAPRLSLSSHQHLATTTDANITLTGTVNDEGGLANFTLNGGVLEPQESIRSKDVNLAIGNNIFTLQASDFAGNSSTLSFTLIREKVPQSPGGGGGGGGGERDPSSPVKKVEEEKIEQVQTGVHLLTHTTETNDTTLSGLLLLFQQQHTNSSQQIQLNKALASIQESDFSQELKDAYLYGYLRGITTMGTIVEANLEGPLTRAAMAKMMSVYATQVLGKKIQKIDQANFQDLDLVGGDLPGYIQLAYQLQIMGVDATGNALTDFNPDRIVTRAEFATVLSRVLYGDQYNQSGSDFYSAHLGALKKSGILTNTTPTMQEMRGWVMLMLMRTEMGG